MNQIFNNILESKSLFIIKYNKKIQKRFNLNIKYYKEYSEIEIELLLNNNIFGTFINIFNKSEGSFYHIFFDNGKEEVKRNYINKKDKIKNIKIIIDHQVTSFCELFRSCKCIESIIFKRFNRNNINHMGFMFCNCTSLKILDLSHFNTNNVNKMNDMFSYCSSLEVIDLTNFNTNKVTNMTNMFSNCSSLKKINLSNFKTNNVTDMNNMFSNCSSLVEVYINNFVTDNVIDMSYMFNKCSSLIELNISNFNTNKVINMNHMFYDCSSLKKLDISNFKTNNVKDMRFMFAGVQEELKTMINSKYKMIRAEAFCGIIFDNYI